MLSVDEHRFRSESNDRLVRARLRLRTVFLDRLFVY